MYYPEQRFAVKLMRLKRQVRLPEEAIGNLQVDNGHSVDVRDVVARGLIPNRHLMIDARELLNLNEGDDIPLLVRPGTRVTQGQAIAGRDAHRGRRVLAPLAGLIVRVDNGRIIFQEMPTIIALEAGIRGKVTKISGSRSVEMEGVGGVVQGVWGNGRNVIAPMRIEPDAGLLSIPIETLDTTYRGDVLVTRTPLVADMLAIAEARGFAGIIAPSMEASLIEAVRSLTYPVMLTVGFGYHNMSGKVYQLLQAFADKQVALDAAEPRRFDPRRPEAVFSQVSREQMPAPPEFIRLEVGSEVRMTTMPYPGRVGKVVNLPAFPLELPNGLRVPGAVVDFGAGEVVDIPLANLEVAGT